LNWTPFATGSGTFTATGYIVQASTHSDFSTIDGSSVTYDVTVATLTVNGLEISKLYYWVCYSRFDKFQRSWRTGQRRNYHQP